MYHELEICKGEKRELVATEIAELQEIKFASGVCCKFCSVPQETFYNSINFRGQGTEGCLHKEIVREAVATTIVIRPDLVVQKMHAWMWSKGIWTENTALSEEEVYQVTQVMLE